MCGDISLCGVALGYMGSKRLRRRAARHVSQAESLRALSPSSSWDQGLLVFSK